jgi:GH35 family endo-1,4-beta-xylanase
MTDTVSMPLDNNRVNLRVFVPDQAGNIVPAKSDLVNNLYVMDLNYDPIHKDVKFVEDGLFSILVPNRPFAIATAITVPGFGYAWLFADNDGKGYQQSVAGSELLLNLELASSRFFTLQSYYKKCKSEGCQLSTSIKRQIDKASALLNRARFLRPTDMAKAATLSMASLKESMWAGEEVAFELAKHRIARNKREERFLFGCNAFKYNNPDGDYERYFREIFNYATLPFYWRGFEPTQGKPNWDRLDRMSDLLGKAGITLKGHPLIWVYDTAGIPSWLEDKTFGNFYRLSKYRIHDIVEHYKGRIDIWDVINEAHEFANALNFSREQLLELTRMACEETHRANPNAIRIINNTMMWGQYAVGLGDKKRTKWTPREYIADVVSAGIDFEVIGIQMYYFHNDILEIDRLLDRFEVFGKPIHITEIGVSSSTAEDQASHVKHPHGLWREPWSEKIQADYLERLYTVAYSKPYVKAITNWDFSDEGGHFWPHGGFLSSDLKPKESFFRLKGLIQDWLSH